jgi:hypothetical protein
MTADEWRDLVEWIIWALIIGGVIAASLWFTMVHPLNP